MLRDERSRGSNILLVLAALAVVIAGLRAASEILAPMAVAAFVAVICLPAVLFLQGLHLSESTRHFLRRRLKFSEALLARLARARMGTGLAVTVVVVVLLGSFVGVGALIGTSIGDFRGTVQGYLSDRETLSDDARAVANFLDGVPELVGGEEAKDLLEADATELVSETEDPAAAGQDPTDSGDPAADSSFPKSSPMKGIDPNLLLNFALGVVAGAGTLLSNSFLVLMTAALLLLEAAGFPAKMREALGNPEHELQDFTRIVIKIQRYLWIKTVVSLLTGVTLGTLCWACEVQFPVLWGLLAFVLNFIPNIGSILAMFPPALLGFAEHGTIVALVIVAGYLVVNGAIGNLLEPKIMGRQLGLSALVVFLSMVFWGWTWGAVGMFLSVPLTMSVKIFLENTKDLRWAAVLMGGGIEDDGAKAEEPDPSRDSATEPRPDSASDPEEPAPAKPRRRRRRRPKRSGPREDAGNESRPDRPPSPEGLPATRPIRSGAGRRKWTRGREEEPGGDPPS